MFYAILTYRHPDLLVENVVEVPGETYQEARTYAIDHFRADFMPDPYTRRPDCEKLEIIEVVGGRIEVDMVKEIARLNQEREDKAASEIEARERAEFERLKVKFGK